MNNLLLERPGEIISDWKKTLVSRQSENTRLCNHAILLAKLGKFEEAIDIWLKVIEINPKDDENWYNLGLAQFILKRFEDAIYSYNNHPDFASSGLHKPSTIRLYHLMTVRISLIQRELGILSLNTQNLIAKKLCQLLTE